MLPHKNLNIIFFSCHIPLTLSSCSRKQAWHKKWSQFIIVNALSILRLSIYQGLLTLNISFVGSRFNLLWGKISSHTIILILSYLICILLSFLSYEKGKVKRFHGIKAQRYQPTQEKYLQKSIKQKFFDENHLYVDWCSWWTQISR